MQETSIIDLSSAGVNTAYPVHAGSPETEMFHHDAEELYKDVLETQAIPRNNIESSVYS